MRCTTCRARPGTPAPALPCRAIASSGGGPRLDTPRRRSPPGDLLQREATLATVSRDPALEDASLLQGGAYHPVVRPPPPSARLSPRAGPRSPRPPWATPRPTLAAVAEARAMAAGLEVRPHTILHGLLERLRAVEPRPDGGGSGPWSCVRPPRDRAPVRRTMLDVITLGSSSARSGPGPSPPRPDPWAPERPSHRGCPRRSSGSTSAPGWAAPDHGGTPRGRRGPDPVAPGRGTSLEGRA